MSIPLIIMAMGGDRVVLNALSAHETDLGGTAIVGVRMDADGQVYKRDGGAYAAQYEYVIPAANAGLYECRWVTQGTTPSTTPGASGTWLSCGTDRTWEHSSAANFNFSFTLELRRAGTTTTLKSVNVTFSGITV